MTRPDNGRARINQVAVDEQLWRNKVGTKVVAFLEDHLTEQGFWSIYLSCNSNTLGHQFWPQVGYVQIVQKAGAYRGGHNIIWAKRLAGRGFCSALGD